ncbi:MAG: 4-amino-4-deoxy-L-arabinose transferase, partial [Robiginitalea sp.]
LFLWVYRRFLKHPGIGMALLLGITMAALMYSKYHAALVILFVLLSNLSLLKNRYAWLALAVSLLCYLPHLNWLYQNDFVSIKFHLFERPNQPYDFAKFTLGFLLNMVALFGLTFPWVYRTLFRFRPRDLFERALKYLAYGVLLFFFISSFQRRIQTQWLIVICIPLAVMVGQAMIESPGLRKWIWRMGLANILILFWLRAGLVYEPLFPGTFESHGNKVWVANLQKVAEGNPVIFENSYRLASMYRYYSREPAISFNNAYYRKNQYSIDDSEALLQGKKVFYISKGRKKGNLSYLDDRGTRRYGYFIENFESFRKLEAGMPRNIPLEPEKRYEMWVYNPYPENIPLSKLRFGIAYLDAYKRLAEVRPLGLQFPPEKILASKDTLRFEFIMPSHVKTAPVFGRAVISENQLLWGLNGSAQRLDP